MKKLILLSGLAVVVLFLGMAAMTSQASASEVAHRYGWRGYGPPVYRHVPAPRYVGPYYRPYAVPYHRSYRYYDGRPHGVPVRGIYVRPPRVIVF